MKAGGGGGGVVAVALGLWEVKTAWIGAGQHEVNRPAKAVPGSRETKEAFRLQTAWIPHGNSL